MGNDTYKKDYSKVIDALNSCETMEQIEAAKRYFDLYMFKWKHMLNSASAIELRDDFDAKLEAKEGEI